MTKLEEIQAKREQLRADAAKAEEMQAEIDYAALLDAEIEHGEGSVRSVQFVGYRAGTVTLAIVLPPSRPHYREYVQKVREAKNDRVKGEAIERLGESCMIYPPHASDARRAMVEARPGAFLVAGIEAIALAEGKADAEKKG